MSYIKRSSWIHNRPYWPRLTYLLSVDSSNTVHQYFICWHALGFADQSTRLHGHRVVRTQPGQCLPHVTRVKRIPVHLAEHGGDNTGDSRLTSWMYFQQNCFKWIPSSPGGNMHSSVFEWPVIQWCQYLEYIAPNIWMNDELQRILKKAVVT
jgi:hypothetical protein